MGRNAKQKILADLQAQKVNVFFNYIPVLCGRRAGNVNLRSRPHGKPHFLYTVLPGIHACV